MTAAEYQERLKHPKWQKKRLKILERDGWECKVCGDQEKTLEIHHLAYGNGDPWEIEDSCLETLCQVCHCFRTWFDDIFYTKKSKIPTRALYLWWNFWRPVFGEGEKHLIIGKWHYVPDLAQKVMEWRSQNSISIKSETAGKKADSPGEPGQPTGGATPASSPVAGGSS